MSDEYITWQPGELPEWLRDMKKPMKELSLFLGGTMGWGVSGSTGEWWKTEKYRMKRADYERLKPKEPVNSYAIVEKAISALEDAELKWQLEQVLDKHKGPPIVRVPDCFPDNWILRLNAAKNAVFLFGSEIAFIPSDDLIVPESENSVSVLRSMQAERRAWEERQ